MQQRGLEVLLPQWQMEQKISGGLLRIVDGKEVKGRRGGGGGITANMFILRSIVKEKTVHRH